jgi:HAMP domain-containing protein
LIVRRPLFAKYAILIMGLAGAALLATAAIEIYFSHRLHRLTLSEVQQEKAKAAAASVSRYIEDITHHLARGTVPVAASVVSGLEKRRLDYLMLLRVAPAFTTLRLIDPDGLERLQVSRLDPDRMNGRNDFSQDPGFVAGHAGRTYFSPIYFFEETEPYMSIAVPDSSGDGSVTLAEVNLKFIWAVVTEIRIGEQGYAYVVDARGGLVAHPDIHRVLQVTDFSTLPQVRAAFAERDGAVASRATNEEAVDSQGQPVLAAYAAIPPLGWFVFVEQLRSEALAPLYAALSRTAVVLLLAVGLALLASLFLARRMVAPIRQLQSGAHRIGAGEFGHRIHVNTGDELEELSEQFNRMGVQLQESYADLERRIAERTHDLEAANLAKSRFLAAASHDLRQPLQSLILFAGVLKGYVQGSRGEQALKHLEAGLGALKALLAACRT